MKHTAEYLFYTILPIIKGNRALVREYKKLLEEKAIRDHKLPYRNADGREFNWFYFDNCAYTEDKKGNRECESYKQFISSEELDKIRSEIGSKVAQLEKGQIENCKILKQALEKQSKLLAKIDYLEDKVPAEMDNDPYYNFTQYYMDEYMEDYNNPIEEILFEEGLIWEDMLQLFKDQVGALLDAYNEE